MKALIAIGILVLILLAIFGSYVSAKNQMVTKNEAVKSTWSQVDVVLQRRADLIPNLVETVKGIASQEQTVFGEIAKAHPEVAIGSYPFFDDQRGPNTNVVLRARDGQKLAAARRAVEDMLTRVRGAH